jgi:hypothetical protein
LNSERATLLLDIANEDIDVADLVDTAAEYGYEQKDEYHVTLLGFAKGREIKAHLNSLGDEERAKTEQEIENLVNQMEWKIKVLPDRYLISREKEVEYPYGSKQMVEEYRSSIVQMVEIAAAEDFYAKLSELTGLQFDPPPTHITIFAKSSIPGYMKAGIGIDSAEQFAAMNQGKL